MSRVAPRAGRRLYYFVVFVDGSFVARARRPSSTRHYSQIFTHASQQYRYSIHELSTEAYGDDAARLSDILLQVMTTTDGRSIIPPS